VLSLPLHAELTAAQRVIVAGCGGGFDVFCGLPLYFALKAAGKQVWLANLSFTSLYHDTGRWLTPDLVEVTSAAPLHGSYFPEKHLCDWLDRSGELASIWCIGQRGPAPVARAYRALVEELRPDTIILVDGGTDSLMRGDEYGLGTPVEDISSIAAVHALPIDRKLLFCLGFGIDSFHNVSHMDVLENISMMTRDGGYLGAFSLLQGMQEVSHAQQATRYVLEKTPNRESIVCTSILAALEGRFGDYHATARTVGSELFINPLMTFYWAFHVSAVADRLLYLDRIRDLEGFEETLVAIEGLRRMIGVRKAYRPIPL
jgi:hypothetical protein